MAISNRRRHQSLDYAMQGMCGPVPSMPNQHFLDYAKMHGQPGSFSEAGEASFDLVVNYCVQFTCVLLAIDTPRFPAQEVMAACIQSKPKISDSIAALTQELRRGKGNSYNWNMAVANAMELHGDNPLTPYLKELVNRRDT